MPQRAGSSLRPSRPTRFPGRWKFQRTSPRRGRQPTCVHMRTWFAFQPTSPRGGRLTSLDNRVRLLEFQPTSPRGGRRHDKPGLNVILDFNPRPHAGDDPTDSAYPAPKHGFQPTSPRGGRLHKSPKTAQLFIRLSHIFSSLCHTNHKEPYSPVPLCTPVPSIMKFSRCEGTVQIM